MLSPRASTAPYWLFRVWVQGKEKGISECRGITSGYIGIMQKNMETAI